MPPPSLKGGVGREWSRSVGWDLMSTAVPLLREAVNFGVAILSRCIGRTTGEDWHLAILVSFRHIIEMADAIQLLLEAPAPYPCRLQLRSAFEALLTVEWIVASESERRAYAFLASSTQRQLARHWTLRHMEGHMGAPPEHIDDNLQTFQR